MTREKLYDALYDRYRARQSESLCNIQMYFREGVGVADHPNLVDTVDKLFEDYAEANSNLSQIEKNEIFALYQLCTLFVSWNAIKEKKIREIINIRKSLFFR